MKQLKNRILLVLFSISFFLVWGQEPVVETLTYEEFLAYVKQHHPVIKQANLDISMSESKLLKARGALDPTLVLSYDDKEFKSTTYWNKFNATFKVPTILGLDFKMNYEQNSGDFINSELTVPTNGLYSAGVSLDLAKGLLMNERMASIRKHKYFIEQTKTEQQLVINEIIYEASKAYVEWLRYYQEELIYQEYLKNAKVRLDGIIRSVALGDKPEIDITEAQIVYKTIQLNIEKVKLNKVKAKLNTSTFLWFNAVPLEISDIIEPVVLAKDALIELLNIEMLFGDDIAVANHPKLKSIDFKALSLAQDYKLKKNLLLPKLELGYNFISADGDRLNSFNAGAYKSFINFKLPIFMRKQRAEFQLSKLKINDIELEKSHTVLALENKIKMTNQQLDSYDRQGVLMEEVIEDYRQMLRAEQRRFEIGESSLFLVNTRERKLFDVRIKGNDLQIQYLKTLLQLFNATGVMI